MTYNEWPTDSVPGLTKLVARLVRAVIATLRGIGAAVRARPGTALAVVGGVLALHVFLPPLVLTVTRKPWTYFAFNPWLARLPDYLVSSVSLEQKLDFLSRVALFWFTADGPYGFPEWGFAVDTMDLAPRAAWSAAAHRCSPSPASSSPGCRAVPSPCSPAPRASLAPPSWSR